MFLAFIATATLIVLAAARWTTPLTPAVTIDLSPSVLPAYAGYSLLRMMLAYVLSLAFTLIYGRIAATNRRAEVVMVPLLDILQSIPILSFLPAVTLALVAAFPHSNIGLELASRLCYESAARVDCATSERGCYCAEVQRARQIADTADESPYRRHANVLLAVTEQSLLRA